MTIDTIFKSIYLKIYFMDHLLFSSFTSLSRLTNSSLVVEPFRILRLFKLDNSWKLSTRIAFRSASNTSIVLGSSVNASSLVFWINRHVTADLSPKFIFFESGFFWRKRERRFGSPATSTSSSLFFLRLSSTSEEGRNYPLTNLIIFLQRFNFLRLVHSGIHLGISSNLTFFTSTLVMLAKSRLTYWLYFSSISFFSSSIPIIA